VVEPGRLDSIELARQLSAADVFVAPFVDGVSSRRTTFVAALQHALPIVATDGPLTDRFLRRAREAIRLVPVQSPERFAAAVVQLTERPSDRFWLAQGARLLYEREFAWRVIADRVLAHLRDARKDLP
jgi:glycosyltransferase involved in cell wall biosynthesis